MSGADRTMGRLRWAAILAIIALIFIVWSLFDPTPVPIIISMSVGQLVGTLSFGLYLAVVVPELWRTLRAQGKEAPESSSESLSESLSESPPDESDSVEERP